MEQVQIAEKIAHYLSLPYSGFLFVAFDRPEDIQVIIRETSSCDKIRLSQYCQEDRTPDMDAFYEAMAKGSANLLLLGLGEYFALTGDMKPLRKLWGMHERNPEKKIIIPIWNGYHILRDFQKMRPYKFQDEWTCLLDQERRYWRYKNYLPEFGMNFPCFRDFLAEVETGSDREICISTGVPLAREWGITLKTWHEVYCDRHKGNIPKSMFSAEQWRKLTNEDSDDSFFGIHNVARLLEKGTDNPYLAHVLEITTNYDSFRENFTRSIVNIPCASAEFDKMAQARRELGDKLAEEDIKDFLLYLAAMRNNEEKLAYLTDTTMGEKFEIVRILGVNPDVKVGAVYPDLGMYMEDHVFGHAGKDDIYGLLGEYFKLYKLAKIRNTIPDELIDMVHENARCKLFFALPTRGSILEKLDDGRTRLVWLDSMGCEYLGFIDNLASEAGLSVRITVARAELPTITSINRGFYDSWQGEKEDSKDLDNIKHGKNGKIPAQGGDFPAHLVLELAVLRKIVRHIGDMLKAGRHQRIILASDHGATRLAIISRDECAWDMPEPGRHGGRCCKIKDAGAFKPAVAVADDSGQWYALADYSRFRGGRAGVVETHGGASLEEVVVPIIEFAMRDELPKIILKGNGEFRPKFRDTELTVAILSSRTLVEPTLHFAGNVYHMQPGKQPGEYETAIPLRFARDENEAHVYEGSVRVSSAIKFKVLKGMRERKFDDF